MNAYLVRTTKAQKDALDLQIARFVYSSNSAFRVVEDPQFIKIFDIARPGSDYKPPNKDKVGNDLLDKVYTEEFEKCTAGFESTTVCLSLDGWSNVCNDPIVCTSITTESGKIMLLDTIDTSAHAHTAEYLLSIAESSILKVQNQFKAKVGSVVTDNAANVAKMRRDLSVNYPNILTYGCSSHLLNLLIQDFQIPGVKANLIQIVKYFRNNHFAAAKYKQTDAPKLTLPSDVRWNSFVDCLECYVKNWPVIMTICEENRLEIDTSVQNLVLNMALKRNCEDLLARMKPIAVALDKLQKNNSTIADTTEEWKKLEEELDSKNLPNQFKSAFAKRKDQALTSAHFLANIIHPVYLGRKLTDNEKLEAMQFAAEKSEACPEFLAVVLAFRGQTAPFLSAYFSEATTSRLSAFDWWKSFRADIPEDALKIVNQFMTASSSTAGLERLFSAFGIVHSDLRNRLGTEKAAKLVFLLGALRKEKQEKKPTQKS